jgi:hypothetical protein
MIHWLHRYVFRGLGVVMLIGMITALILAAGFIARRGTEKSPPAPAAAQR